MQPDKALQQSITDFPAKEVLLLTRNRKYGGDKGGATLVSAMSDNEDYQIRFLKIR